MDKYELVLDIAEHPEKYTPEQLAEILSDPETREIYTLLCKTDSALEACTEIDVAAEWNDFAHKHDIRRRRSFFWSGSRAASIAAIIGTSVVAVAAGLAVTVAVIDHKQQPITDDPTSIESFSAVSADSITAESDSVKIGLTPVMFEDESLEKIMEEIAEAYAVEVRFNNKATASLHLYYRLDPSLPISEVVEQLNTFERINIKQNGKVLTID